MKTVAIIPAREGSKGIPNKNLALIKGKPLVQYSIEAALESTRLNEVWVSSDSDGIIELAQNYPTIKIHKRDSSLASDSSPVSDTVKNIIENELESSDMIMLLQPTAPIRTARDIDTAIELLQNNAQVNSIISVCEMNDVHPARMYWKKNDILTPILSEFEEDRRQQIPPAYYRNGAIYLVRTETFKQSGSMMAKPIFPYIMKNSQLLNIDEPRDLLIAEVLIPAWQNGELK